MVCSGFVSRIFRFTNFPFHVSRIFTFHDFSRFTNFPIHDFSVSRFFHFTFHDFSRFTNFHVSRISRFTNFPFHDFPFHEFPFHVSRLSASRLLCFTKFKSSKISPPLRILNPNKYWQQKLNLLVLFVWTFDY
jgi:hypothetical protein